VLFEIKKEKEEKEGTGRENGQISLRFSKYLMCFEVSTGKIFVLT
jgi:hypothetical protein